MKLIYKAIPIIILSFLSYCGLSSDKEKKIEDNLTRELYERASGISAKNHLLSELDELTNTLILIAEAKDKPKPPKKSPECIALENRRLGAILLLGELGTEKAIQFLIDNITMDLEPCFSHSDMDMIKDNPCLSVLMDSDWRLIPYILKALEQKKTDKEIKYFWLVLIKVMDENSGVKKLGDKRAMALIQSEMEAFKDDTGKGIYINNLKQVKQYLENSEK